MTDRPPLSTLLSQVLIAFTIEFDDGFEQQMPHSTTTQHGAGLKGGGVWLVSQAMWSNYLRFIPDDGVAVADLQSLARVSANAIKSRLNHLTWWNYVAVDRKVARLTASGRQARAVWTPLAGVVEKRWRSRFGKAAIDGLLSSLRDVVDAAALDYPQYPPVIEYGDGLRTSVTEGTSATGRLDLPALLSQVLIRLTVDFEAASAVSLPIAANVVRVLAEPVAVRELPLRSGVSKEAISASLKWLQKHGYITVGSDKVVVLTRSGHEVQAAHGSVLVGAEEGLGIATDLLRRALDVVLSHRCFADGLKPHEGGWRLEKAYIAGTDAYLSDPRAALPHHPMVLHRGGFPCGS